MNTLFLRKETLWRDHVPARGKTQAQALSQVEYYVQSDIRKAHPENLGRICIIVRDAKQRSPRRLPPSIHHVSRNDTQKSPEQ